MKPFLTAFFLLISFCCMAQAPQIISFTPTTGGHGTEVKIKGTGFNGALSVSFGGIPASSFIVDSASSITAIVDSAVAGSVSVTTALGTSVMEGFISPSVRSFSPATGGYGTVVTIKGYNLYNTTAVSFGGSAALSFNIFSDTVISANIGKVSSGLVMVTTATGTGSKPGFIYTGPPAISSFSPASGSVNTVVTITGTGFDIIPGKNFVYFGSVMAQVIAATPTSLTVIAPAGSSSAALSVTSNRLTAFASRGFYTTFTNSGIPLNQSSFSRDRYPGATENFVVGDFNADQKPDIVYPGYMMSVSAYKNVTTGYLPQFVYQEGARHDDLTSGYIASGNLDGDSLPDIVIATSGYRLFVYKNVSTPDSIKFVLAAQLYSNPNGSTNISSIDINDFDGDGKPDIVIANGNSNSISFFRNTCNNCGMPVFGSRFDINFPFWVGGLKSADLDADGRPDIVMNVNSTVVYVLRNTSTYGLINFATRTEISLPTYSAGTDIADINQDGKPDILLSSSLLNKAWVYQNNSSLGALSFSLAGNYDCGLQTQGLTAGDIDGDALPDLLVGHGGNYDSLTVFRNNSSGNIVSVENKLDLIFFGYATNRSVVCDMNLDGQADIITASHVFRNKIDMVPSLQSFTPAFVLISDSILIKGKNLTGTTAVQLGGIPAAGFLVISDSVVIAIPAKDASGYVTVSTPYGTDSLPGLSVAAIPSISSFVPVSGPIGTSVLIQGTGFSATAMENIVLFGTVRAQVIQATDTSLSVLVPAGAGCMPIHVTLPNRKLTTSTERPFMVTFAGAGALFTQSSFAAKQEISCDTAASALLAADLDADGRPDAFVGFQPWQSDHFSTYKNTSNAGFIRFAQKLNTPTTFGPLSYAIADIDADGRQDIITGNAYDSYILNLYLNNTLNGPISFANPVILYKPSVSGWEVFTADFDRDGRTDIIQMVGSVFGHRYLRNTSNNSGISFGQIQQINQGSDGTFFALGDLNGDDKAEIVSNSTFGYFRNTSRLGQISFSSRVSISDYEIMNEIKLVDLDGDGKKDIFYLTNNKYSVLRNTSTPDTILFAPRIDSVFTLPGKSAFADMDGDGKMDIVISTRFTDTVAVIKNLSTPGNISFAGKVYYKTGGAASRILLTDMDLDGKPDILTLNNKPGGMYQGTTKTFSVLRNRVGEPQLLSLCPNGNISIVSNLVGASYQWQEDTGSGYADINDNSFYTGTHAATMNLSAIPSSWQGRKYRCVVNGQYSYEFALIFTNRWTGAANNLWSNAANWSCGSIPDQNTDVIINQGTVLINASTTIGSLQLNPGANLTLSAGVVLTVLH